MPINSSLDDVSLSVCRNPIHMLLCWAHPLTPLLFSLEPRVRPAVCRAKKSGSKPAAPAITFADVAGVENAKEELREVGAHPYLFSFLSDCLTVMLEAVLDASSLDDLPDGAAGVGGRHRANTGCVVTTSCTTITQT